MSTTPIPARPSPAELANPATARIWNSAQEFEAMVLGQLVAPIFAAVDTARGPFGGGTAEETWRPMLAQEMGKQIARGSGLGLAAPVFRQMLHAQELANAARHAAPESTP